jgi:hypothetical protein
MSCSCLKQKAKNMLSIAQTPQRAKQGIPTRYQFALKLWDVKSI